MGQHLQRSAVYEDSVASKHPSNFVAAPESERLRGLTLSSAQLYMVSMSFQVKAWSSETIMVWCQH